MYYSLYYLFFISLYYVKSLEVLHNETVRVRISTGEIEGYIDRNGKSHVHVFKGVPFAEPPVGNLRFSLPKEKSPWHFTWDAKQYRAACMANTTVATKLQKVISEDCLYMNIFADSRCTPNDSCPVIYYIHGGGFFWGSAVQFEDEFVIDRYASDRMVFLIPAYRLGMFGFWDFGDDTIVPRNLGLHDMIMSLKWVQKEILAFGGDPGRVTLMGNSAGASTIQFLSVSPAVPRDYYSNIVISSGSPTTFNGFNHSATNFIVKQSGCRENVSNPNNFSQIVDCLRQVDAFKLLDMAQLAESEDDVFFDGIVSDGPLFHNKTFTQLLSEWKQVPLFIGATKYEMYDHYKNITILCRKYGSIFDYSANRTIQACVDKYDNLMEKYKVRQMLIDSTHAEVYREAALNTRKGQPSYVWEFTMQGHNMHAGDISFMIGTHRPIVLTEEERVTNQAMYKAMTILK
uniref:Carboxylic ester hydrolase n=1 Tax=Acrobeloides nanus TaxID=290746 RepID=A0A914E0V5_9BILA